MNNVVRFPARPAVKAKAEVSSMWQAIYNKLKFWLHTHTWVDEESGVITSGFGELQSDVGTYYIQRCI